MPKSGRGDSQRADAGSAHGSEKMRDRPTEDEGTNRHIANKNKYYFAARPYIGVNLCVSLHITKSLDICRTGSYGGRGELGTASREWSTRELDRLIGPSTDTLHVLFVNKSSPDAEGIQQLLGATLGDPCPGTSSLQRRCMWLEQVMTGGVLDPSDNLSPKFEVQWEKHI